MHRSIQQARGCACSTLLGKVIARADLEIAPSSVIGGGGIRKKGQPQSQKMTSFPGRLSQNVTKSHCGKDLESFPLNIIPFFSQMIRHLPIVSTIIPICLYCLPIPISVLSFDM